MNNFIRIYDINLDKHIDSEYSYIPSIYIDVPVSDLKIFKKGLISYDVNQEYVNTFEIEYYIHNDDKLKTMYIYLNLIKNFVFKDVILYSELYINGIKYCSGYTIIQEYYIDDGGEYIKMKFSTEDIFLWNTLKKTNLRTFGFDYVPKDTNKKISFELQNSNNLDGFINSVVNEYNTDIAVGLVDCGEGFSFSGGKFTGDEYISIVPPTFYIHNMFPHWKIKGLFEDIFNYCGRNFVFDETVEPIFENMVLLYNNKERKYPISLISYEKFNQQEKNINPKYLMYIYQPFGVSDGYNNYNPYKSRWYNLKCINQYKDYFIGPIEKEQQPLESIRFLHSSKYSLSFNISFMFRLVTDVPPPVWWPTLRLSFHMKLIKGKSIENNIRKLSEEDGCAIFGTEENEIIIKQITFYPNQIYNVNIENFTFNAEEGDYLIMFFRIDGLRVIQDLIESSGGMYSVSECKMIITGLNNYIKCKEITSRYDSNMYIETPLFEKSVTLRKFFDAPEYEDISLYDFVINFLKTFNLYLYYDSKNDRYIISGKDKYYKNSKIINLDKYNINTYSVKYYKDVSRYNVFSFSGINIDKKTLLRKNNKTRPDDYGYTIIKNNNVSLLNYNDDVNTISNDLFEVTPIQGGSYVGGGNVGYLYWVKLYNEDNFNNEYKELIKNGNYYKRISRFGSVIDYEFENKFMFGYHNPYTYSYFPVLKYHRVCYFYFPGIEGIIDPGHYYINYGSVGNRPIGDINPNYPNLEIYDSNTIVPRLSSIYPSITTIKNYTNEIYDENFLINYGPNSFLPYVLSFDNLQYPRNIYSVFFEPFYPYNFEYNYIEFTITVPNSEIIDFINGKIFLFNGKPYVVDEVECNIESNTFNIKMIKINFEEDEDFNTNNIFKEKPVRYFLTYFHRID